jgi:hypothetical protein
VKESIGWPDKFSGATLQHMDFHDLNRLSKIGDSMASIHDENGFNERVNYAVARIVSNKRTTRGFDTCFEMGDADYVAVAVYRRSLSNPKLARNLFKYLGEDSVMKSVEKLKAVPTKDLKAKALAHLAAR